MKPKKKVRKSGYYWVQMYGGGLETIARYLSGINEFEVMGSSRTYYEESFSYISTRPLKPGKK